jgi:hypothetical protein
MSVLLRLHRLRRAFTAKTRRLLRVLLLRVSTLPTDSGWRVTDMPSGLMEEIRLGGVLLEQTETAKGWLRIAAMTMEILSCRSILSGTALPRLDRFAYRRKSPDQPLVIDLALQVGRYGRFEEHNTACFDETPLIDTGKFIRCLRTQVTRAEIDPRVLPMISAACRPRRTAI